MHVRDAARVPATDVLIEGVGVGEHVAHVRDAARVPAADVLVEGVGEVEHVAHVRDAARVPATDVLVEGVCEVEHGAHVRDAARVPAADVLVEVVGVDEHAVHVRDAARVPATDVLVEGVGFEEHEAHVRDATGTSGLPKRCGEAQTPKPCFVVLCVCLRPYNPCVSDRYAMTEDRDTVGVQVEPVTLRVDCHSCQGRVGVVAVVGGQRAVAVCVFGDDGARGVGVVAVVGGQRAVAVCIFGDDGAAGVGVVAVVGGQRAVAVCVFGDDGARGVGVVAVVFCSNTVPIIVDHASRVTAGIASRVLGTVRCPRAAALATRLLALAAGRCHKYQGHEIHADSTQRRHCHSVERRSGGTIRGSPAQQPRKPHQPTTQGIGPPRGR